MKFLLCLLFVFGFCVFVVGLPNSSTMSTTVSASVNGLVDVSVSGFSVSPSSLEVGQSVGFSLQIANEGNLLADVSSYIEVRRAGSLVENLSFNNFTLSLLESAVLSKSWTPPSAGSFEARVFAVAGNVSRNASVSFIVSERQASVSGGGGGSAGVIYPPTFEEVLKVVEEELRKAEEGVKQDFVLSEFPFYVEATPSSTVLAFAVVENPSGRQVLLRVSVRESSGRIPSFSDSRVSTAEVETLVVPIKIPENVEEGYYNFVVEVFAGDAESPVVSYPLIVRVARAPDASVSKRPSVTRSITFDNLRNVSTVGLEVKNTQPETLRYVQVYEVISKDLALSAKNVTFLTPPTVVVQDDPIVRWDFELMEPNKTINLYYELRKRVDKYTDFVKWVSPDVLVISGVSDEKISIGAFSAPNLYAGNSSSVSLELFNSDTRPHSVEVLLVGPLGWQVQPSVFSLFLSARGQGAMNFEVTPSNSTRPGIYNIIARLKYDGREVDKPLAVYVASLQVPGVKERVVEEYVLRVPARLEDFMDVRLLAVAVLAVVLFFLIKLGLKRSRENIITKFFEEGRRKRKSEKKRK
ncbi:hypothetical protein HY992_05530 [Candidatus Micrarchaeota archaeon]|nr:hypothetical protein [Candidatus Micrarchaeota archaeon]